MKGPIAANGNECTNTVSSENLGRLLLTCGCANHLAPTASQECSTMSRPIGHRTERHSGFTIPRDEEVLFQKSLVAPANADHLVALGNSGADSRPHASVHPRGIASAAKHSDPHDYPHLILGRVILEKMIRATGLCRQDRYPGPRGCTGSAPDTQLVSLRHEC